MASDSQRKFTSDVGFIRRETISVKEIAEHNFQAEIYFVCVCNAYFEKHVLNF